MSRTEITHLGLDRLRVGIDELENEIAYLSGKQGQENNADCKRRMQDAIARKQREVLELQQIIRDYETPKSSL